MIKDNKIYLYNNNFVSFLYLCILLIRKKIIPRNIKEIDYTPGLFDETCLLDLIEDDKIIDYLIKNIGNNNFNVVFKVFLSNEEDKEILIYKFILYSLKYKEKTIYMKNIKEILNCVKISKYVTSENHKFKGFTRFKKYENEIYYAEINPTNNILYLLALHFKNKLNTDYWIIKDVNRRLYSIFDKKNFYIINEENFKITNLKLSEEESNFENLWNEFYKTIGITERKNDRCRMNFMPKKYWKYILEVSDEI